MNEDNSKEIQVKALHLAQGIDIKKLLASKPFYLHARDPYVIGYPNNRFIAIYKYGVCVFWNFKDEDINEFLQMMEGVVIDPNDEVNEETMFVKVDQEKLGIIDNQIYVRSLTYQEVILGSEILARSTILDSFEHKVEAMMGNFAEVIDSFSDSGKAKMKNKELIRRVGLSMKIRHGVIGRLALLDKPDLAWEDSELSDLYNQLFSEYEIADRYTLLSQKLKILSGDSQFFMDYIDSHRSFVLELTIVLLIVFEIILFFIEKIWG